MTTETNAPAHDFSSLRILDEQRKGTTKGGRAFFPLGVFVVLAGMAGGVHLLKQRPEVEVAVARSAAAPKSREVPPGLRWLSLCGNCEVREHTLTLRS
jgi:hypothetical protein